MRQNYGWKTKGRTIRCPCEYCAFKSFFWYVPHLDINWIEVPKNGSKSIKKGVWRSDTGNKPPHDILKKTDDASSHKPCAMMVRNPRDRLSSLITFFFLNGPRAARGKIFASTIQEVKNNILKDDEQFLAFLELATKIGKLELHHFFPQTYFLNRYKDQFRIDDPVVTLCELGKTESYIDDWKSMSVTNQSGRTEMKKDEHLDHLIERITKSFYADDIELYEDVKAQKVEK